jgi:hypothetical protein
MAPDVGRWKEEAGVFTFDYEVLDSLQGFNCSFQEFPVCLSPGEE